MLITVLVLLWLPGGHFDNSCNFHKEAVSCVDIQQEEFFDGFYENERYLQNNDVYSIEILDSNYSLIESFIDPRRFFPRVVVVHLRIRNSLIQHIARNAFEDLDNLYTLDLRDNSIKEIVFIETLIRLTSLDLNNNAISVLDLNNFKSQNMVEVNARNNSIVEILPSREYNRFSSFDVSHNVISEFNETHLNCLFVSLDMSYNLIQNISVASYKNIINLEGNNINFLTSQEGRTLRCQQLYLTNVPVSLPSQLGVSKIFRIRNFQLPILSESEFDIDRLDASFYLKIDFSNSSLTDISQNYFSNIELSLLNLSYNNFSVLEKSLFKSSSINILDISYSGITYLSNIVFKDMSILQLLNLTGNNIQVVEHICKFVDIFCIDFSHNIINTIESNSFGSCRHLHTLNISNSQVRSIMPRAFSDLIHLTNLKLDNNNVKIVDGNTFGDLRSVIDLSRNDLGILPTNAFSNSEVMDLRFFDAHIEIVRHKSFNNLSRLKQLNLSHTGITDVEDYAFFSLPALLTLDLSNNKLTVVKSYTFINLPVEVLLLYGNKIKIIKTEAFTHMYFLKQLDLSSLEIQTLESFAFSDLKQLDIIDLRGNNITEIKRNVFTDLAVRHIDLTNNEISSVAPINNTVTITKLSLRFNGVLEKRAISNIYLREVVFVNSSIRLLRDGCFKGLYNLEKLLFNESEVIMYESDTLRGLYHLKYLDASNLLRRNEVIQKNFFKGLGNLKFLQVSNMSLKTVETGAFVGLDSIEKLNLENHHLTSIDLMEILNGTRKLKILKLSNGNISNLIFRKDQKTLSSSALKMLFIDNNHIQTFHHEVFHKLIMLETLHLQNNKINMIPLQSFRYLNNLKELRLDNNYLITLGPGMFEGLINLRMLNLSHNIQVSSDSLITLRSLNILNLEHTSWKDINEITSFRDDFPDLREVYINNNPFSCPELSIIIKYFYENSINHPSDNPRYDVWNINGIVC
ncbi:uncharacterized protein [Leptinotarsa decemlineata]|uniref:uncharacterized protein n=1 Tax=Leptinotarsa decemlineata TaxID=7539 RepID=UPI003D309F1E